MLDHEIVRGYALLGLTDFIETQVKVYEVQNGRKPVMVIVGQLEWYAILDCVDTDSYAIAGVPVVPDTNIRSIVSIP